MTQKEFVCLIGDLAFKDQEKTGISASVTAAQAILESGYGTSRLAECANNIFGMKKKLSGNTWPSEWTGETYAVETKEQGPGGVYHTVTAEFRKYQDWSQSIRDHSNYLAGAKNGGVCRYAGIIEERDYKKAAQIIKNGGYATDINYVDKLCKLITDWNLTAYEKSPYPQLEYDDAAPEIHSCLTKFNHNSGNLSRIRYIVIHYVGATGDAMANCRFYTECDRKASAHYYVGFSGDIWQSVEDQNIAWHCGSKNGYRHPECRNANSIGIEMCVRNKGNQAADSKDWYFESATVRSAIRLTRYLMKTYGIPAECVLRHYDVTGKICPNPYVIEPNCQIIKNEGNSWEEFKKAIS